MSTQIDTESLALVVTDPQNDFLSKQGVTWDVVGESVVKNNTVENIERLLAAAKQRGLPTFISPHYYYLSVPQSLFEPGGQALAVARDSRRAERAPRRRGRSDCQNGFGAE